MIVPGAALANPQYLSANIPVRVKDAFVGGDFGDIDLYMT